MALLILIASVAGAAEEIDYLASAYTPEALAKVREWEKIWVGKKIDKTNIANVSWCGRIFCGNYWAPKQRGIRAFIDRSAR